MLRRKSSRTEKVPVEKVEIARSLVSLYELAPYFSGDVENYFGMTRKHGVGSRSESQRYSA